MKGASIVKRVLEEGRKKLYEDEALNLLRAYGLPVPAAGLAKSEDEALRIAGEVGYPVVLKIVSPDIIHKSDVGGVILGLEDPGSVREAYRRIIRSVGEKAPNARVVGVLVQHMVPQGLEVIIGATRDPVFDSVVMFGLGGVFVEVLRDVSFRVTPLTRSEALAMTREIKAHRLLEGYRNTPPRDREALAKIILGVAEIMDNVKEIREIDLNPVMSYTEGAVIADARILVAGRE